VTHPFDELIDRTRADADVLGVVLSGSHARGMAGPHSDHDVYVVVEPSAVSRWPTTKTRLLDTIVFPLDTFRGYALPGGPDQWNRYSFAHAPVLLDRLDGEIALLVAAKGSLSPGEADRLAREVLDAYVNSAYRAAKNRRDGRDAAAHLDGAESVSHFLTTLFATYGRVRPYNKYLEWELTRHPLDGSRWDGLVPQLRAALEGSVEAQHWLTSALQGRARECGLGDVLDSWGDEVFVIGGW
jgi:hypothetical protein